MDKQALIGYTGKITKMADESIRLYIDFQEKDFVQVASLFGKSGTTVAVAVISGEVTTANDSLGQKIGKLHNSIESEKVCKGGDLAKGAAILCKSIKFQQYVAERIGIDVVDEDYAAFWLRERCEINSRSEIDHNEKAAFVYNTIIGGFNKWLKK